MSTSIFIPDVVEENINGIFATNPIRATLPVIVAGTDNIRATATNTVRQELVVVACANLKETNFQFDSSVVGPGARDGFVSLATLLRKHVGAPMTIFGHADPSFGQRDPAAEKHYNHALSERRARSIFAVLVRDVVIWEQLFSNQEGANGDVWGIRALQLMLASLGNDPGDTNVFDKASQDAIRAVLGLAATSPVVNNAAIRALLFAKYMDFLRGEPTTGAKFPSLTPNDFLGRGKQKASVQGCSSFNPQLLLSKTEQKGFDTDKDTKDIRDAANEPNRRVVIYLFKKGTVINPKLWPCPAATEGEGACVARQWSNGKDRRSTLFVNHRRRFGREVAPGKRLLDPANQKLADDLGEEETTFGCRFYHGIALHSPCERDVKLWGIQLLIDAPPFINPISNPTPFGTLPLGNRRFVAVIGNALDAPTVRGRTSKDGVLALPLFDNKVPITLKIDAFDTLSPPKPPPANPPAPAATPAPSTDTDRFDDEDKFLVMQLDAGALQLVRLRDKDSQLFDKDFDTESPPLTNADRELAGMQRLYNLGFGKDDTGGPTFAKWSDADRRQFVTQFQRASKLTETGIVDAPTADAMFTAHGS